MILYRHSHIYTHNNYVNISIYIIITLIISMSYLLQKKLLAFHKGFVLMELINNIIYLISQPETKKCYLPFTD
jgi:hypothetical protein